MIDGFIETFPGAPLNELVEPHIGADWGEAKAGETPHSNQQIEPDYNAIYDARLALFGLDGLKEESRLRTLEFTIAAGCRHGLDPETSKQRVLAAIKERT